MIKEFTLGATKWTVEEIEQFKSSSQLGESLMGETKINISKTWCNEKVSDQSKDATLYHEVVHAMLDSLAYYELSQNEKLVQGLSVLMKQFEETKK